ncbi:MAG: hypothetical protein MUC87_13535 [Bacteroidia bacterium]|jgi:hypothetical protein|nr:hypothetical protein [Bacteroidia bacterium]
MEINNQPQPIRISRRALRLFGTGALVVYLSGLAYCIASEHYFESGLLGGALVLLSGLTWWIYQHLED